MLESQSIVPFTVEHLTDLETENDELRRKNTALQQEITLLRADNQTLTQNNAELTEFAYIDPLTKAFNLRGFNDACDRTFRVLQRLHPSKAVYGRIDLDRFKKLNDTLGHDKGDMFLKLIVEVMTENTRGYDVVGRVGGDEFDLLLAGLDVFGAKQVINRIRSGLAEKIAEKEEYRIFKGFGFSAGLCPMDNDSSLPQSRENTDIALYRAKIRRNAIAIWETGQIFCFQDSPSRPTKISSLLNLGRILGNKVGLKAKRTSKNCLG